MQKRRLSCGAGMATERQRGNHFRHFPLRSAAYRVQEMSPEESTGVVHHTSSVVESDLTVLRHSETYTFHARLDLKAGNKTD
jgi:hypothetical protein